MKFIESSKKTPTPMLLCLFVIECERAYIGTHSDDITHTIKYKDFARGYFDQGKYFESSPTKSWSEPNEIEIDTRLFKAKVIKWVAIQDLQQHV